MIHHVGVTDDFDRFFVAEQPKIVALGLAWTGDREFARDLAQETLLRAYRDWGTVSALAAPGGWLHRVAINLLIDDRRWRNRREEMRDGDRREETTEVDEPIAAAWRAAIRALPDRQRATFVLHYVADMSHDQIADALGVTVGTVKAALAAARMTLKMSAAGGAQR